MRPLRVLHVIPALAPRYGGPSRAILAMGSALVEAGAEVHIASTDADGAGRIARDSPWLSRAAGCEIHLFPKQFSEALKFSRPLASWLAENVHGFDAVHIHAVFSHACVAAARAASRAGVPFLVRPLGTVDAWSLEQKKVRKRVFFAAGAMRLLDSAAGVHCTSEQEEEGVLSLVPSARTFVSPLGVESPGRKAERGTQPEAIVFLGRLHPKKRVEVLVEAFARIASRVPHELVIAGAGDDEYAARLAARAAELLPGSRIRFTGWLEDAARTALFDRAAVVVLPSHQENFGLAAAEAMGYGIPVVLSSGIALASEVAAARAGWIVEASVEPLAATLLEALESPAALAERGANALALARARYSWPAVAAGLAGRYGEVSGRAARST